MREVSPEECKKLQLNILINVAKFCDEHDIKYSLAYGTLIGAIRHKGFIPWDDDIDIIMMRDEYERFVSMYKSEEFDLVDGDQQANHLKVRISDRNTCLVFQNSETNNKYYESGVWVDVFPIDMVPDNPLYYSFMKKTIKRLYLLMKVGEVRGPYLITKLLHPLLKPFSKPLLKIVRRMIVLFNGKNTHTLANMSLWYLNYPPFPVEFMTKFVEVEFDGYNFKAISQYHEFLTSIYGDYMQLPPLEKRVPRHGFITYWREG